MRGIFKERVIGSSNLLQTGELSHHREEFIAFILLSKLRYCRVAHEVASAIFKDVLTHKRSDSRLLNGAAMTSEENLIQKTHKDSQTHCLHEEDEGAKR